MRDFQETVRALEHKKKILSHVFPFLSILVGQENEKFKKIIEVFLVQPHSRISVVIYSMIEIMF